MNSSIAPDTPAINVRRAIVYIVWSLWLIVTGIALLL